MAGIQPYIPSGIHKKHIVLDMTDSFTCSFTEFFPFCNKLYYFSNFKDFNTSSQAWLQTWVPQPSMAGLNSLALPTIRIISSSIRMM